MRNNDLNDPRLAINGGTPVRAEPWAENITTGREEADAVRLVMEDGYLSLFEGGHDPSPPFSFWGGPRVQELESAWCEYYGSSFAVSVNSATSGLFAAVGALKLGYGDEIIVSPFTMSACAVCALVYGAIPIFADVCLETGCLDPDSIQSHITTRTRAIVVVHQFGNPAEMDRICEIADKHNIRVIEDCAQAHGAKYKGRYVGTWGAIGVFSLNVNKTIQTGEGGVCITDDEDLRYRLALIRNHGEAVVEAAEYEDIVNILGFNYRLTELQAAVGVEQLKRLDDLNQRRMALADYLSKALDAYPCFERMHQCRCRPACGPNQEACVSTAYSFTFRYFPEVTGVKRGVLANALRAEGIRLGEGNVRPLYLLPIYQRKLAFKNGYPFSAPENQAIVTNYERGACPNAETLHFEQLINTGIVRPPHTMEDILQIVEAVEKVVGSP